MNALRSLLYVPALAPAFLAKAHTRGADAIIVDLEDAIPPAAKPGAREALGAAVRSLLERNVVVWVRINSAAEHLDSDLRAAAAAGVHTVLLPKVETANQLQHAERALDGTAIELSALVETPLGILNIAQIAGASRRLKSLCFGSEDLSLGLAVNPCYEALSGCAQMTVLGARAYGLHVYGVPGSVAGFQDLAAYRHLCVQAKTLGFDGVLCIHPAQVEPINTVFTPTAAELGFAKRVVEAFDAAAQAGTGAISVDGEMVDLPVVERARRTLARR